METKIDILERLIKSDKMTLIEALALLDWNKIELKPQPTEEEIKHVIKLPAPDAEYIVVWREEEKTNFFIKEFPADLGEITVSAAISRKEAALNTFKSTSSYSFCKKAYCAEVIGSYRK